MASISLDDNLTATLTDEEIEAIKDDNLGSEEIDQQDDVDDENEDDEGSEDDSDDDGGEAPEEPAVVDGSTSGFRPTYQAQLPEDFTDKTKAIETKASELAGQFREGSIDFDEYTANMAELNVRRDALTTEKIKAEISAEMRSQEGEQRWTWTVNQFIARVASDEKIDYRNADAAKLKDLDVFVRALASDESNANQSAEWFLAEAHKRVKALHGLSTAPASGDKAQEKPAVRKPNLKAVPQTLAHVHGSDGPGDVGDEFANLDQLDGMDLEMAIAKMSPAQREKFARAG
jgi:hypothetical protein